MRVNDNSSLFEIGRGVCISSWKKITIKCAIAVGKHLVWRDDGQSCTFWTKYVCAYTTTTKEQAIVFGDGYTCEKNNRAGITLFFAISVKM